MYSGVPFVKSAAHNNQIYLDYWIKYQLACTNMFEWENLPESCDAEFLEETLFFSGQCIFLDHETAGFVNLKCTALRMNFYNKPIIIR